MAEHIDWDAMFAKVKVEDDAVGEIKPILKPCPFCGCGAIVSSEQRHSGTKDKFYFVGCGAYNCIASLHSMNRYWMTEEAAIEAWNRRSDTPC